MSAPPTLRERRHRGLARRLVAVRRHAVFVMPQGERPLGQRSHWGRRCLHDAADTGSVREHIKVIIVPLAGWTRSRRAFED